MYPPAHAQGALAHEYLEGRGVERNQELGLAWLRIAAARGEPLALYHLGNVYRRPDIEVVEQDPVQTYKWWTLMSRQLVEGEIKSFCDPDSAVEIVLERRGRIAEKMTPKQIAQAQRLADEWSPKSWSELRSQIPPL